MRKLLLTVLAGILTVALAGAPAQAAVIGIWSNNAGAITGAQAAVASAGHTSSVIANLSDPLGGFDVVWILQSFNGPPTGVLGNEANLAGFVQNGGVLSFHDRNVNQGLSAAEYIPGAGGVTFVNNFSAAIDVVAGASGLTVIDGPGGVVTDTNLDGGNWSNHGYALLATLPAGAVAVLDNGNDDQIVDFFFPFGSGYVYYSSIPLDFYIGGNNAFANIYAVNEVAFQAQLSQQSTPIPEPASIALWGLLGLGAAGYYRRRQQRQAA